MGEKNLDKIYIRDLQCRCIVGINDDERINKQDVIINLVLEADLRAAAASDNIDDTIDYKRVKLAVLEMVEQSSYLLVERLADRIAQVCLADPRVHAVEVTLDKPGALRFARSVAIHLRRDRADASG